MKTFKINKPFIVLLFLSLGFISNLFAIAGVSANSFTYTTNIEGSSKTFDWKVLSSTSGTGTILTVVKTQGSKGTATVSGNNIIYTPNINEIGSDSFVLTISDSIPSSIDITITVNGISTSVSTSGVIYTSQPQIVAVDEHGNIDTDYVGDISISKVTGTGALSGTKIKTAVSGNATFSDLKYTSSTDKEAYSLQATDTDLSDSESVTVISDILATKLVFTTQVSPLNIQNNVTMDFTIDPVVQAQNSDNHLDTDFSELVSLSANGPAGKILTNETATAIAGVSTFTGLTLTYNIDETFQIIADDVIGGAEGDLPSVSSSNIIVASNIAPTLTTFIGTVSTINEDTEGTITFSQLNRKGDESDIDGTVDAYIIQSVNSGTLKIGSSSSSATTFSIGTNDTINATNNAYWKPDTNLNGELNAFTVKVKDNDSALSSSGVQVKIDVPSIDDITTSTTIPSDVLATEDVTTNINLSSVSLSDIDSSNLTVVLNVNSGIFKSISNNGVSVVGNDTNTLSLSGTISDINTFLGSTSSIKYLSEKDINGDNAASFSFSSNGSILGTVNIDISAVDDKPILETVLEDRIQEEDSAELEIQLSTIDVDSTLDPTSITYLASSSNTNVATVLIVNGKLIVIPVRNAVGTTLITVSSNVNGSISTKTFNYTLTEINDGPSISNIGDITENQSSSNITKTIVFDIWDDIEVRSLSVSSSNINLIPNINLSVDIDSSIKGSLTYTIDANNIGLTTITVVASDGELIYNESFNINVDVSNDSLCVENTKTALTFDSIKLNNTFQNSITSDLDLINTIDSICNTNITWSSSDITVVDNSGSVKFGDVNKTISLDATITKGEFITSKSFLISVPSNNVSDLEALSNLTFMMIKENNHNKFKVTSPLNLIKSFFGKEVSWISSNENVISPFSGFVTRLDEDKNVVLTAIIGTESKTFKTKVLKLENSSEEKVKKDKELLTLDSILGDNRNQNNIIYNLLKPLPQNGVNGSVITWATSNTNVITVDGDVFRDKNTDKYITVIATITNDGIVETKEFIFKVIQNKIIEDSDLVFKNATSTNKGTKVVTSNGESDIETTSTFTDIISDIVDNVIDNESVQSILEFVDRVINIYLNTDGSSASTLENNDGTSSFLNNKINGSKTNLNLDENGEGEITSTSITENGSITLQLESNGRVTSIVNSLENTSFSSSDISGSLVSSDLEGNVETSSTITQNGYLYRAFALTDINGNTKTKYEKINKQTGDKESIQDIASFPAGSSVNITQIDGYIYISTRVPLDGDLIIE